MRDRQNLLPDDWDALHEPPPRLQLKPDGHFHAAKCPREIGLNRGVNGLKETASLNTRKCSVAPLFLVLQVTRAGELGGA
ncbi:hypothetical protein E2C01_088929 [Portunus trituberculatus]|uniref:Uncharacterized protein n=1 Tax=Portunus trituberculatus TaxID=210409 RepID=A0A5B7JL57_PORTR|nr:hypothetical protein [Portunus trituberculatus]